MERLKLRLTIMNFLQFFVWGSWLITISAYWFQTLPKIYPDSEWSGAAFGAIFSTMGWAALIMPSLFGIVADKWINAERLLGILHLCGAVVLYTIPLVDNPGLMFWVMLLNMCFYMPTLSLSISVAYSSLKRNGRDVVKEYPPIRVWGTIGFIIAMWTVSLLGFEKSANQFYIAGAAAFLLGIYAFTLPKCPPESKGIKSTNFAESLGLNAFSLFRNPRIATFFIFSMLLGAALQLTNMYGDTFLHDFEKLDQFKDAIAVKYPAIIMSISQISETVFILAIPFFMKRFGIKNVMLMSMFAWVLRFALFAYGDPLGGLWMIILSCVVYGMAFDFFNISGSLFIETQTSPKIRSSAQGLFMMMTNGFGAILGSMVSGIVIDMFFTNPEGSLIPLQWKEIWLSFAGYALVVGILFMFLFKNKEDVAYTDEAELRKGALL